MPLAASNLSEYIDSAPSEEYIIASAMNDPDFLADASAKIRSEMFSNQLLGHLWKSMCKMSSDGKPTNLPAIMAAFPNLTSRLSTERLVQIDLQYMGTHSAEWHVSRMREYHVRRQMVKLANEVRSRAIDTESSIDELHDALEEAQLLFDDIADGRGLRSGIDEATTWLDSVEARYRNPQAALGMSTGWGDVDAITLGWQRKDLIIVGGRTSVGKSAFSAENAIRMYRGGFKVGIFSLEMSAEQIRNRIAANISGVRLSDIRTGNMGPDEVAEVAKTIDVIAEIAIDDSRRITADWIVAEMKRWKRTHGLDFVVVDYLQEIEEPSKANDNTGSALARVARKLRKGARDCDCAVMALSQLGRDAEGKKPSLRDLFGSSGLENSADVVVLLHRDKDETPNTLEVNIPKQRNGQTGSAELYYDLRLQRIGSMTRKG